MTNTISQLTPEKTALLSDLVDLAKIVIPSLITLFAAILSAPLAYRYAKRKFEREKQLAFLEKQLTAFYSPMVGRIARIRTSSELRVELSSGASTAWKTICDENPKPFHDHDKHFAPFKIQIEKENERFPKVLLPIYQDMADLFTKQYWVAEKDTREFYKPFCRYVELWERYYDESIPPRVLEEVPIEEDSLVPFYNNIESHMTRIRENIASGTGRKQHG